MLLIADTLTTRHAYFIRLSYLHTELGRRLTIRFTVDFAFWIFDFVLIGFSYY